MMPYSQPLLALKATENANYSCMAENFHVDGRTVVTSSAVVKVTGEQKSAESE